MDELKGKTLVFTDCHLGLNSSSISRLNIVVNVFKEILKAIKSEHISNVIFAGDAFHDRRAIDVNVLNVGYRLFSALAKICKVYLIVGNHDCHYKSQTSVNSVNIFKDNPNIIVVNEPTECTINGSKCLLVPWLSDLSKYSQGQFDMMFGHFNISEKYLIASYVEDHTNNKSGQDLIAKLSEDEMLSWKISSFDNLNDEMKSMSLSKTKSNDLVGDFVTLVKEGGEIYSGHIHQHKEFFAKKRQFIFIGSPYQQNFGEMDSIDGYYILDEMNKRKFYHISNVPKFVKIHMTRIIDIGLDKFDFSIVRGNIIRKIYDTDIDKIIESKIDQKIIDNCPYDELLPEYEVKMGDSLEGQTINNETLDLIKKSKMDYIRKYIDEIDQKSLDDSKLNRETLFQTLKDYYDKAEDQKRF